VVKATVVVESAIFLAIAVRGPSAIIAVELCVPFESI
jgi:hypothetical protein